MHYVSVENLTKSYGIQPLFRDISFHISQGDKIALVARNGSGKSTLLKILAGKETPDEGKLWINKDVTVVLFEQDPVFLEGNSIIDNIFLPSHTGKTIHPVLLAIKDYEEVTEQGDTARLNSVIMKMDELNAWDFDSRVKQVMGKLNIHHLGEPLRSLSGGQRKRVALARVLIDAGFEHKHVLLIMDEPTNHLDLEMVEWLEDYLDKERLTLLLVTHDRYFLDAVCNEIWELSAGPSASYLHVYKGDYENYLEKKSARVENEVSAIDKARNTYRRELEWMRKQPKARTTKSKSRQDNFYLVEKKAQQRVEGQEMELAMKMNRLGGKVVEMKKVYKRYGDKVIVKGFDYTFKKGERIGIAGKNAVGKSTFINMVQGLETPDSGKINIGETVIFGNYSQQGLVVKEDMRVIEYVKTMAENFPLASGGSLSAAQFLQLFLFDPDKQYTYLSLLSGGEKRRLHLLSILFRNPNFLMLDEPTNDLDLPTLGVLENFLIDFPGNLLIVSHDRYFMDRLIDHLFVFEGDGFVRDFPGNYSQYRLWQKEVQALAEMEDKNAGKPEKQSKGLSKERQQLSFKEKREFDGLEKELGDLNREKKTITEKLHDGSTPFDELEKLSLRIGEVNRLLDEKELRWLELSERH